MSLTCHGREFVAQQETARKQRETRNSAKQRGRNSAGQTARDTQESEISYVAASRSDIVGVEAAAQAAGSQAAQAAESGLALLHSEPIRLRRLPLAVAETHQQTERVNKRRERRGSGLAFCPKQVAQDA